jgi:hypothetical protein
MQYNLDCQLSCDATASTISVRAKNVYQKYRLESDFHAYETYRHPRTS